MRELVTELKGLWLHGMAAAWGELTEQGQSESIEAGRWVLEHLLQAEAADRSMRSVRHHMHVARFPVHRDLTGFDFDISPVDRRPVMQLADCAFT
jgi:DNA replication protein DnaC